MLYREHAPPPGLSPWLECTWERRGDGGTPVRVLPDGCIDIVWTHAVNTEIVGANTTAFLAGLPPGTHVVGARLRPGGAPALLGLQAELVRDARIPIARVLDDEGARLASLLDDGVDPVTALRDWLRQRARTVQVPDGLVAAATRRLDGDAERVGPLARELGVSERTLHRRVTSAVGYGPKRLGRVLRLRRALARARAGDELGRVAADAGYADQAHFCGDCRELARVPPSVLLAE